MYLKSLVLKGFKSFADRSVINLEPGITAIVGPNGSGKSNISDAVLWVLGERNAKHLRGQSMEDVIFAGSASRKATSYAEATLVLDNSDATLPVDYAEVAISRRMYRNGESDYLINGSLSRRLDVLDILHDSGIGTGTQSIISQGKLDAILQSKPEDRRAFIEEAAGVLKHKQRKLRSERKLEAMNQHLLRVRDVVAEIERQLGPLERRAKKAKSYQLLTAELHEADLQLAVDDLRRLQQQWNENQNREKLLSENLDQAREKVVASEADVEALQEKIRVENADASELSRQHRASTAALERFDSSLFIVQERERNASLRSQEFKGSLEASREKYGQAARELRSAQQSCDEVEAALSDATASLEILKNDHERLSASRLELDQQIKALNVALHEGEQALDELRRRKAASNETLTDGRAQLRVISQRLQELVSQCGLANKEAEQARQKLQRQKDVQEGLEADQATLQSKLTQGEQDQKHAHKQLEEAREKQREIRDQIAALDELQRAAAAAESEAQAWLWTHNAQLDGRAELLATAIKAPKPLEALVEYLLGSDVGALLINDVDSAQNLYRHLESERLKGEFSLLLRKDTAKSRRRVQAASARLIDQLDYAQEDAAAVEALLGDVVLCDSLDSALKAHEQDGLGLRFVSAEGAVVWPNGKLSLGARIKDRKDGALARIRQREALREDLTHASEALSTAEQADLSLQEHQRTLQQKHLELSQRLATARGELEAAQQASERLSRNVEALDRERQSLETQKAAIQSSIDAALPNMELLASEEDEATKQLEAKRQELNELRQQLQPLDDQTRDLSQQLSAKQLSIATLSERKTYAVRMQETRRADIDSLKREIAQAASGQALKAEVASRLRPIASLMESLIASAKRWVATTEAKAASAQDSSSGLYREANRLRQEARLAHEHFDEAQEALNGVRVEKGRLEIRVQNAVNVITADCGVDLERALELPPLEERDLLEEQQEGLRRRIARLGNVNLDAAEEYDELKQRFDYLTSQLTDLRRARKALDSIEQAIDEHMRSDFYRTFNVVNENFQEIFATLFPGGIASLSLVEGDDSEESGVEVTAQPPGKRLTKMSLMSGGEKSLTALALLFAVYRTRATPFYILDEVEAALDDTNLRRLMAYIDKLRTQTQLIMITHQRRTMEMADVLLGVSMHSDGITKVVSQKLDRALMYAED